MTSKRGRQLANLTLYDNHYVLFGSGFRFCGLLSSVSATVGGTPVEMTFAGAQGMFTGPDQANLRLPRSLIGRGEVEVVLTVDGQTANTVRVVIR